ncbi:MAG TPA: hypothetical protein VIY52_29810 [Streptosporangiaceae bacterium]
MITPVAAALSNVSTTPRRATISSTQAPASTANCQPTGQTYCTDGGYCFSAN